MNLGRGCEAAVELQPRYIIISLYRYIGTCVRYNKYIYVYSSIEQDDSLWVPKRYENNCSKEVIIRVYRRIGGIAGKGRGELLPDV